MGIKAVSRSLEPEILDRPDVSAGEIRASLDFMGFVNRFLGGSRAVTDYFDSHETPPEFTVLDLGCGGGDIPYALSGWASRKGKRVRITALDTNPHCLDYARSRHSSPDISYLDHSAFAIEALGPFDYVISSMFFHHLSDANIVRLLRIVARQSRRGFLINDLYRHPVSYFGAAFLGLASLRYIAYHDAKLSVKKAFRKEDFLIYSRSAGIENVKIETAPAFRLTMSRISG